MIRYLVHIIICCAFISMIFSFIVHLMDRWAGQALFGTLTPDIVVLTLLYNIAGLGIAIVNDFKSVEGDRAMVLQFSQ
ncbi:unnamed protein product [Brassica oleracea]